MSPTSVDEMLRDASAATEAGVGGVILFGIPDEKDPPGPAAGTSMAPFSRPCGR